MTSTSLHVYKALRPETWLPTVSTFQTGRQMARPVRVANECWAVKPSKAKPAEVCWRTFQIWPFSKLQGPSRIMVASLWRSRCAAGAWLLDMKPNGYEHPEHSYEDVRSDGKSNHFPLTTNIKHTRRHADQGHHQRGYLREQRKPQPQKSSCAPSRRPKPSLAAQATNKGSPKAWPLAKSQPFSKLMDAGAWIFYVSEPLPAP